jgi:UDP-3-O-[3-hydroxymyristoyl] glucosamine N-acyltransferase
MKLAELSESIATQGFPNTVDGDPDLQIHTVNTLGGARAGEISFLSNPKYRQQLQSTQASAVIITPEEVLPDHLSGLRSNDPYAAMTAAMIAIHGHRRHPAWGVHRQAVIAGSAKVGANPNIGPHTTICEQVVIGANVTMYPGCFIGDHVQIGDDVVLYPNVVVYDHTRIGDRVTVHANTVAGGDGLGYAPVNGKWLKIPQAGRTVIEDDVEIGVCCALERATLGETRIGRGSKLSDLVVIGHGTQVGESCMFVAQVGVAGSVNIGDRVTLGGQAGISGHLSIGDDALVGPKSAVWSDVEANAQYQGTPPATHGYEFRRQAASFRRLPQFGKRLRALERKLAQLRRQLGVDDE